MWEFWEMWRTIKREREGINVWAWEQREEIRERGGVK